LNGREILGLVAPMGGRLRSLVELAEVKLAVEAKKLRELQLSILGRLTPSDYPHAEPYGFTARPHEGAEAVVINIAGDKSDPLVIQVMDRRYRLQTLETGEVAIYDDQGAYVTLTRTGIELEPATAQEIRLGSGATLGVARAADSTVIDATTDTVFLAWMASVSTVLGLTAPPTVSGKITGFSSKVKAE
jgi:phage baseplate assembly protein V